MATSKSKARTRRADSVAAVARDDAWESDTLGWGTEAYDKFKSFTFRRITPMTAQQGMDLFCGDDLARRICTKLPSDAMKLGYGLKFPDDPEGELAAEILDEIESLEANVQMATTRGYARACGGAGSYVGVLDNQTPDKAVNLAAVRDVPFLNDFDRREVEIAATYAQRMGKNYGKPARYRMLPSVVYRGSRQAAEKETREEREIMPLVHESRMLMFGGVTTPRTEKQQNQGWDYSVLDLVKDVLKRCNSTWYAIGHMAIEASQAIWKLHGLGNMARGGKGDSVTRRMRLIEMGRSVTRAVIIGEKDEFTRLAQTFTGIEKLAETTWQRLATAADMPMTVLVGSSPAGMNATGESDIKLWYDRVHVERTLVFQPVIVQLVTMLLAKRGMAELTGWQVIWPELWLESPKERADRRHTIAETDAIAVDKLGVLPEEVALSRFREDGWNAETQIDSATRTVIRDAKLKRAKEAAEKPPEPPPGTPGAPPPPMTDEQKAAAMEAEARAAKQKAEDDADVERLRQKRAERASERQAGR